MAPSTSRATSFALSRGGGGRDGGGDPEDPGPAGRGGGGARDGGLDAARRIQYALQNDARIHRYHVRVEHQESLHPHNAVSSVSGDALESRSS